MPEKPFFVTLKNRGLLHLEGPDRHAFLQGLITNDMGKLSPVRPLYACLLNPQGKFLHDFFVLAGDGFTLLDCEGGERAQDLYRRLNMYRLRADVQISVEEDNRVYAIFDETMKGLRDDGKLSSSPHPNIPTSFIDPRHPDLGRRSFDKPDLEERLFEEWDKRRIILGIPDGSRDLVVGASTMDEGHMDRWNGVDYKKGCYVGQELTARMHYRGLGKKHLETVQYKSSLRASESERSNPDRWIAASPRTLSEAPRNDIVEIRSTCGDIGLALVRSLFI